MEQRRRCREGGGPPRHVLTARDGRAVIVVIVIVVVVIVVGRAAFVLVLPEMEVMVVERFSIHHVLVAEGDLLQARRGQPGQGKEDACRHPEESGGTGASSFQTGNHVSFAGLPRAAAQSSAARLTCRADCATTGCRAS